MKYVLKGTRMHNNTLREGAQLQLRRAPGGGVRPNEGYADARCRASLSDESCISAAELPLLKDIK